MIIKIILITLILSILVWFLTNRATSRAKAGVRVAVLVVVASAIAVVIFPGAANDIAKAVGVGRGADLILYMLTIVVIFYIISSYIHSKDEQRRIAVLARKIAILEANELDHNRKIMNGIKNKHK